jgi:glucosamine-6-phosphate deaminase
MHLLRFDSVPAWISGVCSLWRDRLRMNPALTMCLPTGLTPAAVYAELAQSVRKGDLSFARASVFALDEFGGLEPEDPGLTKNTLRRQLVSSIDLPDDRFHFLDPHAEDLGEQCRRYDAAIDRFDLVLLGIGLNGHLGMNEPGSDAGSPTRRVDLHESTIQSSARYFEHANLPRWGLTVGLGPILAAKEVWLLATGAAKAHIVRETVDGDVGPQLPASLLRNHPNCAFFLDADAGALL